MPSLTYTTAFRRAGTVLSHLAIDVRLSRAMRA
jgi:hypothetical protein